MSFEGDWKISEKVLYFFSFASEEKVTFLSELFDLICDLGGGEFKLNDKFVDIGTFFRIPFGCFFRLRIGVDFFNSSSIIIFAIFLFFFLDFGYFCLTTLLFSLFSLFSLLFLFSLFSLFSLLFLFSLFSLLFSFC